MGCFTELFFLFVLFKCFVSNSTSPHAEGTIPEEASVEDTIIQLMVKANQHFQREKKLAHLVGTHLADEINKIADGTQLFQCVEYECGGGTINALVVEEDIFNQLFNVQHLVLLHLKCDKSRQWWNLNYHKAREFLKFVKSD